MLYTLSVYGCSMNKNNDSVKQEELCPECGCDAMVNKWETITINGQHKGRTFIGSYCYECEWEYKVERKW